MFKDWILIGVYTSLSVVIITQVFNGLDQQAGLDSKQALQRAEQSIGEICANRGFSSKGMRLVDATAPAQEHAAWRFDFRSPSLDGSLTIEVDGQGHAHAVSVQPG